MKLLISTTASSEITLYIDIIGFMRQKYSLEGSYKWTITS